RNDRAGGAQAAAYFRAEPAARTRDQRHFSFQTFHRHPSASVDAASARIKATPLRSRDGDKAAGVLRRNVTVRQTVEYGAPAGAGYYIRIKRRHLLGDLRPGVLFDRTRARRLAERREHLRMRVEIRQS